MEGDKFQIKRKSAQEFVPENTRNQKFMTGNVPANQEKKSLIQKLKMPEIDTNQIFQKIFEDANQDMTIYKILTSILHICRSELVI